MGTEGIEPKDTKTFKYLKIPKDIMSTKQINFKISRSLLEAAERYVQEFGYRNIQELAAESIREKIFEKNDFDATMNEKQIELIDSLIELSLKKKVLVSEEELTKVLLK